MRQVVELLVEGHSYHQIADELDIAYTTMLRIAPKVTTFVNDETRALAQMWQAVEFARLESASEKLLPHIMWDDRADDDTDPNQAEAAAKNAEPPDPKLIAAYRQLVSAKLAVLTLNRQKVALPDDTAAADDQAGEKARMVGRFMELSHRLVYGIVEAGVGSGEAEPGDDDEDDYEDGLTARADNSGSIADAVVIDKTDFDDDNLDSKPGQWIDDRFYASEC
jgi:hypothetical protein